MKRFFSAVAAGAKAFGSGSDGDTFEVAGKPRGARSSTPLACPS